MKTFILALFSICFISSLTAQVEVVKIPLDEFNFEIKKEGSPNYEAIDPIGVEYLIIEKVPVDPTVAELDPNLSAEAISYRLFLDMKHMDSIQNQATLTWTAYTFKFLGVSALSWKSPAVSLSISSSKPFYNNVDFGGIKGEDLNVATFELFPVVQYDSYVTNGRIGKNHVGVLTSVDPKGYVPITPSTTPVGTFTVQNMDAILTGNATSSLEHANAVWSSPAVQGPDSLENIVFIGQFTTEGNFNADFTISIQANSKVGGKTKSDIITVSKVAISKANNHKYTNNLFTAYPNPVEDKLYINITATQPYHQGVYQVYDVYGRTVRSGSVNTFSKNLDVDMEGVRPGVYFMDVVIDNTYRNSIRVVKK